MSGSGSLEALRAGLAARGTHQLLVRRGTETLCEWAAPGWEPPRRHHTASLAKAIVGGVALLVALGDGALAPEDPVARYVPQWRDDPVRSRITVRHLATHASGIENAVHDVDLADPQRGWMADFWRRDGAPPDPFTVARDRAPVRSEPGSAYHYSNPGMAMLGYCLTAALRDAGAPHTDLRTLLRERVYRPLGLADEAWSIGYGAPSVVDGLPLWAVWGGGEFTPRAVESIGRLVARHGVPDGGGAPLLDARWVDRALRDAGAPLPDRQAGPRSPASALCWYANEDGVWPDVPRDAFAGAGARHQLLFVVPSLDLVAVRFGEPLKGSSWGPDFWTPAYRHLMAPLVAAVR